MDKAAAPDIAGDRFALYAWWAELTQVALHGARAAAQRDVASHNEAVRAIAQLMQTAPLHKPRHTLELVKR